MPTMLARTAKGELPPNCIVTEGTSERKVLTSPAIVALLIQVHLFIATRAANHNGNSRRRSSIGIVVIIFHGQFRLVAEGQSHCKRRTFYCRLLSFSLLWNPTEMLSDFGSDTQQIPSIKDFGIFLDVGIVFFILTWRQ